MRFCSESFNYFKCADSGCNVKSGGCLSNRDSHDTHISHAHPITRMAQLDVCPVLWRFVVRLKPLKRIGIRLRSHARPNCSGIIPIKNIQTGHAIDTTIPCKSKLTLGHNLAVFMMKS